MTDLLQVDAELVASSGLRFEFDACDGKRRIRLGGRKGRIEIAHDPMTRSTPSGEARLAVDVVHDLERRVLQILAERKLDDAMFGFRAAGDEGVVGLLGLAIVELTAQLAVSLRVPSHDDDPAGVPIEPMDDLRLRMDGLHAAGETVRLLRADPRNGQQTGGLVQHDQSFVEMENRWDHGRW